MPGVWEGLVLTRGPLALAVGVELEHSCLLGPGATEEAGLAAMGLLCGCCFKSLSLGVISYISLITGNVNNTVSFLSFVALKP